MKSTTKLAVGDRASLVLRNWLLLYFSVKTKSSVHYNFLNIHIIFAALRIHARADTVSINQALHPNRSIESASIYVISAMTPATMCRDSATLYGADALEQALSSFIFQTYPTLGLV